MLLLSRNDSGRQGEKVKMFINNNGMDMEDEQELESGVQLTRSDDLLRRGVSLSSVRWWGSDEVQVCLIEAQVTTGAGVWW